jgi:integral membrane sensor domain MASE1
MRVLNAALDWLIWFGAILACAALAGMSLLIVLEVILRSVFSSTMYLTEEFSGYMVLAVLALGVAYCREKHSAHGGFSHQAVEYWGEKEVRFPLRRDIARFLPSARLACH